MFDHFFKKKEVKYEVNFTDLTRKNRVEKNPHGARRRPRTAPGSLDMSVQTHPVPFDQAPEARRSLQDEMFYERDPPEFSRGEELFPPAYDVSAGPSMGRSSSSGSFIIRNPFRSNTSDSLIATTGSHRTAPEPFADPVDPIQRTVPTYLPQRSQVSTGPEPLKAAIFTTADPFTDGSSLDSGSPTSSSSESSSEQGQSEEPQPHRRWSFLKSTKTSRFDFLQVTIPSGVLSPLLRDRHSFTAVP